MRAVAVLCSRRKSSRLPYKAFMDLGGRSAVGHCLARLRQVGVPVILAVPPAEAAFYFDVAKEHGAMLYCGEPESPLHRTAAAVAKHFPSAQYVLRATHDDPLVEPVAAMQLLSLADGRLAGYSAYAGMVEGAGLEVIRRANLDWAVKRFQNDGEYIGYYVKGLGAPNPTIFRPVADSALSRGYRLTLDYHEDYLVLQAVLGALGPDATAAEACAWLDRNPDIAQSNLLPEVSFYTCAKDAQAYVGEAIRSVALASQQVRAEYVFVDDASTDGTLAEALRWRGRGVDMKILRNRHNEGLAASSNLAIGACRGKWVMRVDADDVLIPHKVPEVLNDAEGSGLDVLYTDYSGIDAAGAPLFGIRENDGRHAGCALMRRSALYEAKFRDGVRLGDWAELRARAGQRLAQGRFQGGAAWFYRRHRDSVTAKAGTGEA